MAASGKVAIVTGSATGTGRSIAFGLAERGWDVVINYTRSLDEARETATEVEKLGRTALVERADVSVDAHCRGLVDATIARFGRIDALVNNAGTTVFVPFADLDALTEEAWDRTFAVNVKGAFLIARAAAKHLREARGAIVNVSSIAGQGVGGSSIAYAASKAALDNLTVSLARTLAPEVRVNGVAPGFVDTRWLAQGYGDKLDAVRARVKRETPLRDAGRPEHVAQAVVSLVTGMDWVTGQTIVVDGGFTIRG